MSGLPPVASTDVSALLTLADETQFNEARSDKELRQEQEAKAFAAQITAALERVSQNRTASDERLQSTKDKTNGSLGGLIAFFVLLIVTIVAAALTGGAAAPLILAIGGAVSGAMMPLGNAIGNKMSEDNEEAANVAQELADELGVEEKELEKLVEDYGDDVDKANDLLQQILDAQRNRNEDYRNTQVTG